MDRGACKATVHVVAKSRTQLSTRTHTHTHTHTHEEISEKLRKPLVSQLKKMYQTFDIAAFDTALSIS